MRSRRSFARKTYGHPVSRKHVVQIEIDRSLYLDEARVEPLPSFSAFCLRMARVTARLVAIGAGRMSVAAE